MFAIQGAPPVLTPVENGKKISITKFFTILFGHLWEVELT
jgi:hypothetical protein